MNTNQKADHEAAVDMVDGLIAYANQCRINAPDLAQAVATAAAPDLTGLDALFADGGLERADFTAVATGYIVDRYHLSGDALVAKREALIEAALQVLKQHPQAFNAWVK